MRILHVTEVDKGGTLTVVEQLVNSQIQEFGPDNILCLIPASARDQLKDIPSRCIRHYCRSGRNLTSLYQLVAAYLGILLSFRPDIVHIHSSFAGFACRLIMVNVFKIRIVYSPHAWAFLMDSSRAKIKTFIWIEKVLSFMTSKIICVSLSEMKSAIDVGIPQTKLICIHNGISIQQTGNVDRCLETGDTGPTSALYVGRHSYQKGFDILLSAITRLPADFVRLKVVGLSKNDVGTLEDIAGVEYAGWQPPSNLRAYYEAADVVILPSRWEGLPMVALEACANGTAVLASNLDAHSEIIVPRINGDLFPVGDPEALSQRLRQYSRSDWHKMGNAGKEIVRAKCDLKVTQQKTIEVYRTCLGAYS